MVPRSIMMRCIEALERDQQNKAAAAQTPTELLSAHEDLLVLDLLRAYVNNPPMKARQYSERQDVLNFHQKFGVPMPIIPSLLDSHAFKFRVEFMQEELDEFTIAHTAADMLGAADALVDLCYVLHGTALMMGLPWPALWEEVQRANMTKERATSAGQSKRGTSLDVIKPEGWRGPDHSKFLGQGPWPVFNTQPKE